MIIQDEGPYYIISTQQFITDSKVLLRYLDQKYQIEFDNHVDDCLIGVIEKHEKFSILKKLFGTYKTFEQLLELAKQEAIDSPCEALSTIALQRTKIKEILESAYIDVEKRILIPQTIYDIFVEYEESI